MSTRVKKQVLLAGIATLLVPASILFGANIRTKISGDPDLKQRPPLTSEKAEALRKESEALAAERESIQRKIESRSHPSGSP